MTQRNERLAAGVPPGIGAIAYARALFAGMTAEQIENAMPRYLDGEMRDSNDKRVKDCLYCGYLYKDGTKSNNSKTCSPECKKGIDAVRKVEKRTNEKTANPNRKYTITERHYDIYDDLLEYPFWNAVGQKPSDSIMDAVFYQHETTHDSESLANIDAALQTRERIGGRRRVTTEKEY